MLENLFLEVSAIQSFCLHDGPGIRTTIFLKGCYLDCFWCCNPESISVRPESFFNKNKCLYLKGIQSNLCIDCELAGGKHSKYECKLGVFKPTSIKMSVNEVLAKITRDSRLFSQSGGGVTFSGGEPFMQAAALLPLLQKLKEKKISIAFETSGYFPHEHLETLLGYIDFVYLDLKFQYGFLPNKEFDVSISNFDENINAFQNNKIEIKYRLVYLANTFSTEKEIDRLVQKLKSYNIHALEILCFHPLAKNKYQQLDKTFFDYSPRSEKMNDLLNKKLSEISNFSYSFNTI
jgi:pyruvate formate lyase activating enzyme